MPASIVHAGAFLNRNANTISGPQRSRFGGVIRGCSTSSSHRRRSQRHYELEAIKTPATNARSSFGTPQVCLFSLVSLRGYIRGLGRRVGLVETRRQV